MLLIPCPHCGERDECEFAYGGHAVDFPELQADLSAWHHAIHLADISDDNVTEVWFHADGCECWILLQRNIRTHEFHELNKLDQSQG